MVAEVKNGRILTNTYLMEKHYTKGWCHICGRRQTHLVGVRWPDNAEHETLKNTETGHYVRICVSCICNLEKVVNS